MRIGGVYVTNDIVLGELNLVSKEYEDNIIVKTQILQIFKVIKCMEYFFLE